MDLKDTVAIVTGSSSGVGAATARYLAARGAHVVINYSRSRAAAEAVAAECSALGPQALAVQADVAEDAHCRRLVAEAVEAFGRLDVLVNNAGTTRFCAHSDLEGLSKADFLDLYAVNTVGAFQMTRAAAPYLQRQAVAHVVNTASIAGVTGIGSSIAYAASKGALLTMTLSLARVLGPRIRVNAVCPGFIQGEWLKQGMGEENYEKRRQSLEASAPLRATCTPEDVAAAIGSFITGSDLVTGESLIVDGGAHLGMAPQRR